MIIGVDARCLAEEKISGVGEYALEVIRNLLESDKKNQYVIFTNSYRQTSDNLGFLNKYSNATIKRFRYPNKLLNLCIWYFGWPKLDKLIGGVDVFFAPNINFLAVSKDCRLVTTFHDLSFERYPSFFTKKTRLWHYFFVNPRKIAKKSWRLIAVSKSTSDDLQDIYKIGQRKISVIRHGIDRSYKIFEKKDQHLLLIQKKYKLPEKFILYLGNIEPRKNIGSIINSYKKIRKFDSQFDDYKLVLAGNISPFCRKKIESEEEAGSILSIGYIDRKDKVFVYNLASLLLYPSFFEGFGLPAIEAMACGTPAIVSNNSSLPEVSGISAITVNPDKPDEIAASACEILKNKELREMLRQSGIKQAKKFSWLKCAEETYRLFEA